VILAQTLLAEQIPFKLIAVFVKDHFTALKALGKTLCLPLLRRIVIVEKIVVVLHFLTPIVQP
jgi:hypothetical protein